MTVPVAERAPLALVAGATGPIGRAVVAALAQAGHRVVALSRSGGAVPGSSAAVAGDLLDPQSLDRAVTVVEQEHGPVTVLVNAAHPHPAFGPSVADTPPEELARQLAAVSGHAALCARVLPRMRITGQGRIVYLAGATIARPLPGASAYAAAKAAGTALTRHLAVEEGSHGITANVVAPGRVVAAGSDPEAGDPSGADPDEDVRIRTLRNRLSLPDFPTPQDVARVVTTLVASSALTGQTLWVTGGEPIGA